MHETGTMLDDLLLQMAHDPAQLGGLPGDWGSGRYRHRWT